MTQENKQDIGVSRHQADHHRTDQSGRSSAGSTAIPESDTGSTPGTGPDASTREVGGRAGPDPARYGDWEKNGRCIDF